MKIRAEVPLPLGRYDHISREVATSIIGQKFPAKVDGVKIGTSTVTDVNWRDSNDVILTIETEVDI